MSKRNETIAWNQAAIRRKERTATVVGFPFFDYNERPVEAVREGRS